jgi:hypothetical protein
LFGVGDGFAAGLAEGLADVLAEVFEEVFEEDLDFAKEIEARPRQRTPAMRKERSRGAFIGNKAAG